MSDAYGTPGCPGEVLPQSFPNIILHRTQLTENPRKLFHPKRDPTMTVLRPTGAPVRRVIWNRRPSPLLPLRRRHWAFLRRPESGRSSPPKLRKDYPGLWTENGHESTVRPDRLKTGREVTGSHRNRLRPRDTLLRTIALPYPRVDTGVPPRLRTRFLDRPSLFGDIRPRPVSTRASLLSLWTK